MVDTNGQLWRWHHNVSECHYHIQIAVKYRKALLDDEVQQVIREIFKGLKERFEIEIYEAGFDGDHIHILCQFLPKYSGGQVVGLIKKITATRIFKRVPRIEEELWGGEFWSDGYYIGTVSNRGDRKTIERYIKNQGNKPEDTQLKMFNLD